MTRDRRRLAVAAIGLSLIVLTGCARERAAPVQPGLALATLETVLDGWKEGQAPADFQHREPPVVVQDIDWQNGANLVSYWVTDPGQSLDANLHCNVRLVLRDAAGQETEKDVTYIVGTDPVLTVFRKIF